MMPSGTVTVFAAALVFFSQSSPAVFLGYCCLRYQDALLVGRSSFSCVAAIFPVHPALILLSAPGLLNRHVGAHPTNIRES